MCWRADPRRPDAEELSTGGMRVRRERLRQSLSLSLQDRGEGTSPAGKRSQV